MAQQTIILASANCTVFASNINWTYLNSRPQIDSAFTFPGEDEFLAILQYADDGRFRLDLDDASSGINQSSQDLSDEFEADGSVSITTSEASVTVHMEGSDPNDHIYLALPMQRR